MVNSLTQLGNMVWFEHRVEEQILRRFDDFLKLGHVVTWLLVAIVILLSFRLA